jgi:hypothetical protein
MASNRASPATRTQMSALCSKIPAILVERIEASHPARAHFLMTELEDWPEGTLTKLERCGLFQVSDHAEAIVCPGCDWRCHKRISARKTAAGQLLAYIVCDEEPAHGQILVTDHERARYHASLSGLARLIADLLGQETPKASASGSIFLLGTINGRHGAREVCIALDDGRLRLRVGQRSLPLVDVLSWNSEGFAIDKKRVRQFAGRKLSGRGSAKSDRTRQQQRSRATAARNRAIFLEAKRRRASSGENWSNVSEAIARMQLAKSSSGRRLSGASVRRIIYRQLRVERK